MDYGRRGDSLFALAFRKKEDTEELYRALCAAWEAGRESGEDGRASEILVVYDRSDGRMVWRGRLSYPGEYEIQGLSLLPRDGA